MWERVEEVSLSELRDPVLLVSLSTSVQQYRVLYSHARELGKFMLKKMKFDKAATLYSSSMPPLVIISDDGIIRLSSTSFYRYSTGERDIVLLAGDSSPVDYQYEYCESVIRFAKAHAIPEIVSIGTRWTEEAASPVATPKVKGFATSKEGVRELEDLGVEIVRDEPAPYFASLIVALAQKHQMKGFKLSVDHGEPIPHPRSLIELLGVLQRMLHFQIDTTELGVVATRMAETLQSQVGEDPSQRRPGIYG